MLVVLSVVEQRLDAVRLVLSGVPLVEVAQRVGVHRSTLHRWVSRYLAGQVAGLADRSHRPGRSPVQVPEAVETAVAEIRRMHPRWGSRRIRLELLRGPLPWADPVAVPSERTIDRVLARQGLVRARRRPRPRDSCVRFERSGPMQLWQMDIVGGIRLVDPSTGVMREAKVVTGIDDHSRYCVCAAVVERATGRAVCLAFAQALARFGVPDEVLTDNGKQFTDRFGGRGEVLFDKICRKNGVTHRLTAPRSPNQNGKVERFHGTFRPEFLDEAGPFTSVSEAQVALDIWVVEYNQDRPHQGLDTQMPVTPSDRFTPEPESARAVLDLWVPSSLQVVADHDRYRGIGRCGGGGVGGWAGAVREGGLRWREHDALAPSGVGGTEIRWDDRAVLGRLPPDPRVRRRHPDQDFAFASECQRCSGAGCPGCGCWGPRSVAAHRRRGCGGAGTQCVCGGARLAGQ